METEQIPVDRLIDGIWEVFDMRLTSIGAIYTVWGSLVTPEDLTERFLVAKGERHLLDKRRRLTRDEEERRQEITGRAESALKYVNWARQSDGQPILQDALVSYITAFESALKSIAIAFRLFALPDRKGGVCFVSHRKHKEIIKAVSDAWSPRARGTVQDFFRTEILERNPVPNLYIFDDPATESVAAYVKSPSANWSLVQDAFRLRNAIVHSSGKLKEQVEIGAEVFRPWEEIRLTTITLNRVESSMRNILEPINPFQL